MEIGVVLVTYNRIEKLKTALSCFDDQEEKPAYIMIVDNASTDGTGTFLEDWLKEESLYERIVISSESNTGGSGGFYQGLKAAIEKDTDWIWLSDDDAFPEPDALQKASSFLESYGNVNLDVASICGAVINKNHIDFAHRKNMVRHGLNIVEEFSSKEDYDKAYFEINCFSYVGCIINRQMLLNVGLTNKDYFLWWDDTEHSLRLSKAGKILCVPAIRIHHDVDNGTGDFTWKTYYGFRNMADLYKRHFPRICYEYFCFKLTCKTLLFDLIGKDKEQNASIRKALKDCRRGKFGVDDYYKPGWKPKMIT